MEKKIKAIGGEFGFSFDDVQNILYRTKISNNWFASGRSALFSILINQKVNKVFLPEFICESVIRTVIKTGIEFEYYCLDPLLQLDFNRLPSMQNRNKTAILIINYFGLQNIRNDIKKIKNNFSEITIILDNVQNSLNNSLEGSHFAFNSYRKMLPVADGAYVTSSKRNIFTEAGTKNDFYILKMIGSLIKHYKELSGANDKEYLKYFEKGEERLNESILPTRISDLSYKILSRMRILEIKEKRKQNYFYMKELLINNGIKPFICEAKKNIAPLAIPILLENRDKVREQLKKEGIFLPIHWKNHSFKTKLAKHMSKYELSLVIDQRYSNYDLERIVKELLKTTPRNIDYVDR